MSDSEREAGGGVTEHKYAAGGYIPTPEGAQPVRIALHPDECVIAYRGGHFSCVRHDHGGATRAHTSTPQPPQDAL